MGGLEMSITFNKTIIHSLQIAMNQPIISAECVTLSDSTEAFITKRILEVMDNPSAHEAVFESQASLFPETELQNMLRDSNRFQELSETLAEKFFRYMAEYQTIKDGDLIITSFTMNDINYLGMLKINYLDRAYSNYIQEENVKLIETRNIYENKVGEAAVIKLDTLEVLMLDNTRTKYLGLLLELKSEMSIKEKLFAIDQAAATVIDEHYENPHEVKATLKKNIAESIARTGEVDVEKVIEQTFENSLEEREECINHLLEMGIGKEKIDASNGKVARKYSSYKFKTDTQFEVKLPIQLFGNQDYFQIENNPNGTMNIIIKNVSQMVNK